MNKNITNYQSALDINEIWAAIEPQVDEINAQRKKKRKPVFLYWLSGAILLIGLVTTSFFLFRGEQTQTSETHKVILPSDINPTTAAVVAVEDKSVENSTTKIGTPIESVETKAVSAKTTPIRSTKNKSNQQYKTTTQKRPELVLPTAASNTKNTSPTVTNNIFEPNNIIQNYEASTIVQSQEEVSQSNVIAPTAFAMTALSKLSKTEVGLKIPVRDLPELNFSIKNNKSIIPPPVYIEKPTFSVEFQTGISAVVRTLTATGIDRPNLDTLLNLRNTFEAPLEALHANLLVNAHFPSGFYVSSGVAFTQISEVYTNSSTQSEVVTDPMGIQKRIVNITGDTIDVIGPVDAIVTTTFSKKFYNTYRMIDIPVFVGYQYDFGDWKTDFSLGVFANLLLATEGRIPDSPTSDLDLGTNGDEIYRSRVDYSLQFGIGVSKSLTDKLSIRVNPSFRYYSNNFIKEDLGLNQRYLLFGGTVGLRMDL